jgi:hypothetical protein
LDKPGVLISLWYMWFGIAGLHWGSYGPSDERRATTKVKYIVLHVLLPHFLLLSCAALLPQFISSGTMAIILLPLEQR